MDTRIDEIAERIYRVSTYCPGIGGPGGAYRGDGAGELERLAAHLDARLREMLDGLGQVGAGKASGDD